MVTPLVPRDSGQTGPEEGTVTLSPLEQRLLKAHALLKAFTLMEGLGIEKIADEPIGTFILESIKAVSDQLPKGLQRGRIRELTEKIERLIDWNALNPSHDDGEEDYGEFLGG